MRPKRKPQKRKINFSYSNVVEYAQLQLQGEIREEEFSWLDFEPETTPTKVPDVQQ